MFVVFFSVWTVWKLIKHLGDTQFHICMKTVVCCSVLFYVAVTEFVERGMTEVKPVLVKCIIICSNVGICCCLLTDEKRH